MKTTAFLATMLAAAGISATAHDVSLTLSAAATGDGGRGFGVLAEYPDGGPRHFTITRRSAYDNPAATPPNYFRKWGTFCNLRIYDPDGFLAAYLEMGDQSVKEQTYEVDVPEGKAGIWRFCVSGGFAECGGANADEFDIKFEAPGAWGVRGEKRLCVLKGWPGENVKLCNCANMKLCKYGNGNDCQDCHKSQLFTNDTNENTNLCDSASLREAKGWMVFSPDSDRFYLTGRNVEWRIGGAEIEGERGKSQYGPAVLGRRSKGAEMIELAFDSEKPFSIFVDGLPGLVSPTPEMAARLNGGLVQAANGEWLEGPLQAAAMNLALAKYPEAFAAERLNTIKETGAPRIHDLFNYAHRSYAPGELAEKTTNEASRVEAIVCGLSSIARMDAAGILRGAGDSRQLAGGRIDCATMFEPMHGIGRGLLAAKPFLSPDEWRIYREGALQIADKEQGFMCFESNQWMHILEGLCKIFLATGERRMERAFSVQLAAFLRDDFHGKHGQTKAGFFSEEYGPDGNYDQMSLAPLVRMYLGYRESPGADAALLAAMREGIERNLRFRSLFAIPDPATTNGAPYQLAYAMNHRTDGPTHFDSHHGLQILTETAPGEFPLAEALWKFGRRGFKETEPLSVQLFTNPQCSQIDNAINVNDNCDFRLVNNENLGLVNNPQGGFAALRRGPWYGIQFWKVYDNGADGFLGPLLLWHEKAGMGLCGVKHSYKAKSHWFGKDMTTNDLTFATVYGTLDGAFYDPSRKMRKTFAWDESGKRWTVTGTQYATAAANHAGGPLARGTISWTTDFLDDDAVEMEIAVDFPDLKNPVVNIPFLKQLGRTVWESDGWRSWRTEGNRFAQESASGVFTLEFPEDIKPEIAETLTGDRGWTMAVRLPVPKSGRIKVRLTAEGAER